MNPANLKTIGIGGNTMTAGRAWNVQLRRHGRAAVLLFMLAWIASPVWAANVSIALSAADQTRLGLQDQSLSLQRRASQIDAFAKVLDPGPLAQLEADLLTAESSAAASKAEADRARALHASDGSIASKDVEAAVAQADDDASKLNLLRRRLGLEWGPGIAGMSAAQRAALIRDLADGRAALVHVDTPSNEGQAGARTVDVDVGDGSVHGVVLGAARTAEPRLQSSGLIVKVSGRSALLLSIGLTQSAHINSTSAVWGVVVPRSAVVRYEGSDWVYIRRSPTEFERRLLQSPIAADQGLFVSSGMRAGDRIVVRGASELFAVEQAQVTRQH
jgi:hypothetical protein